MTWNNEVGEAGLERAQRAQERLQFTIQFILMMGWESGGGWAKSNLGIQWSSNLSVAKNHLEFHLDEVSKVVKFIEAENQLVDTRGKEWEEGKVVV